MIVIVVVPVSLSHAHVAIYNVHVAFLLPLTFIPMAIDRTPSSLQIGHGIWVKGETTVCRGGIVIY